MQLRKLDSKRPAYEQAKAELPKIEQRRKKGGLDTTQTAQLKQLEEKHQAAVTAY